MIPQVIQDIPSFSAFTPFQVFGFIRVAHYFRLFSVFQCCLLFYYDFLTLFLVYEFLKQAVLYIRTHFKLKLLQALSEF